MVVIMAFLNYRDLELGMIVMMVVSYRISHIYYNYQSKEHALIHGGTH